MFRKLKLNPDVPKDFIMVYSGLDMFDIAYKWGIDNCLDGMMTFFDDNNNDLGVRTNQPSKIRQRGEIADYAGCEATYYCKENGNSMGLFADQTRYCVADGKKYYQYTAVDECSRWTFREMYDEHSTYSSKDFIEKLVKPAPFPIREVQTDNGPEFTNRLLVIKSKHLTMFENALIEMGIIYHRIQPRHNGKVFLFLKIC